MAGHPVQADKTYEHQRVKTVSVLARLRLILRAYTDVELHIRYHPPADGLK